MDISNTFSQYGYQGNTSVVDGLGRVFLPEKGNVDTIFPGLRHVKTCDCPLPYADHATHQLWQRGVDKFRCDPVFPRAAVEP